MKPDLEQRNTGAGRVLDLRWLVPCAIVSVVSYLLLRHASRESFPYDAILALSLVLLPGAVCGLAYDLRKARRSNTGAAIGAALSVGFYLVIERSTGPSFQFMPLGFELVLVGWGTFAFLAGYLFSILVRWCVSRLRC